MPALVAHDQSPGFESVEPDGLPFEFMLNALRLLDGVPVVRWQQTTGMTVGEHPFLLDRIGQAQAKGLLSREAGVLRATPRGLELLNDLQAMFLA